ncbi:MAG: type ISP restriction/modification enzyme [Pyrinomonadaceae bacterium]
MSKLEIYLHDLRDTRATGEAVKETSFYPALANLLNAVGAELNPKVRAVINLKNRGAGLPDGGLFTAKQLKQLGGDEVLRDPAAFKGQQPERGVLEVKGTGADVRAIAASEQVTRYLKHYGQVLVTNLREFLLAEREPSGATKLLEGYTLAENEKEFWRRMQHPRELAQAHETRLTEYLKRVLLSRAPLDAPEALAWFLASYARDARERIEREQVALESLRNVREALEQALGLQFEGAQGEQFFRSTLVQTLFYGVFSAWVLWARLEKEGGGKQYASRFDWRIAQWSLHVPAIRTLFEQVVTPTNMRGLGLEEVLNWTADTLNRVEREKFFARFEQTQAVQYFYEPFLEAFDPALRKQLGVWYTPTEIVRYMVERTDRVLRAELQIADGLADERVYVLDPCCGTGAYLVEVLQRIKRTIAERGGDALAANDLKRAATGRVFGFEILPAPFVVAHLQLGLLLQAEGSPLAEGERVGVYLTNALTGWEPPKEPKKQLPFAFHALEEERDAAERVKQQDKILVVIGNPPYNGYASVAMGEERNLTNAYRTTKQAPPPEGSGLNNLFVRFFRMAERRIVEMTGEGVVCFISPYSWLKKSSFPGMRERYLEVFDEIWIDSLNGDKHETGKLTPDGKPDPSVFSTRFNREGIQVGTAISLLVRREDHAEAHGVKFRQFWGKSKKEDLLDSLSDEGGASAHPYTELTPAVELGLPFMPLEVEKDYLSWPLLPELFPVSFPGVKTSRDDVLVDIDRDRLVVRMEHYFDPKINHEEIRHIMPGIMESAAGFRAEETRDYLRSRGFLPQNVVKYLYRPFDVRWLYWELETKLLDRNRPEYFAQIAQNNSFIFCTGQTRKHVIEPPLFTRLLNDLNCMDSGARGFPLYLLAQGETLFDNEAQKVSPNLSDRAKSYLRSIESSEEQLFYHALSIISSPLFRLEHSGALRSDFPRVPLPATRELLAQSAALGRQVAALLDTETAVAGVTTGQPRPELRAIANIRRMDGAGQLNPQTGDLELRADWGHKGRAGVVMPGKGRIHTRAADAADTHAALGAETHDIMLNDSACWANVPARVWDFHIGGYQVIKKWLSYREYEILGRSLTTEEAREVTQIARRIAALLLLEPELDANYARTKAACYAWPQSD